MSHTRYESTRILYLQQTNVKAYEVRNKPVTFFTTSPSSKWSFSFPFLYLRVKNSVSRAQWPCGLRVVSAAARLLGLRVRISPGVWRSVSSECFVCCQVEVSPTGWSLVQRSPTEYGVSECDHEASVIRRTRPTRGSRDMGETTKIQ